MALKRISPIQEAIGIIDQTIRQLRLQRAELVAKLPPVRPKKRERMYLIHPITGEKHYIKCGK